LFSHRKSTEGDFFVNWQIVIDYFIYRNAGIDTKPRRTRHFCAEKATIATKPAIALMTIAA